MKIQINCPVCSYQDITGDTCPNCDTNLQVIRMLQELPQLQKSPWSVRIAWLMLIVGIVLGLGTNFIFSPMQLNTAVVSHLIAIDSPLHNFPVVTQQPSPELRMYTVKQGDNLSAIADKFCRDNNAWQIILQANPQLKGRENSITIGEVIKIPSCQGV